MNFIAYIDFDGMINNRMYILSDVFLNVVISKM